MAQRLVFAVYNAFYLIVIIIILNLYSYHIIMIILIYTLCLIFLFVIRLSVRWHLQRKTGEVLRIMDRGVNSINMVLRLAF